MTAAKTAALPSVHVVRIIGEPTTPNEAFKLAEDDKYQFQWWALGLVGARPVEQKKGADHGIDGKILFRDDPKAAKPESIIIQVKGGKTGVKDARRTRPRESRQRRLLPSQTQRPAISQAATAHRETVDGRQGDRAPQQRRRH